MIAERNRATRCYKNVDLATRPFCFGLRCRADCRSAVPGLWRVLYYDMPSSGLLNLVYGCAQFTHGQIGILPNISDISKVPKNTFLISQNGEYGSIVLVYFGDPGICIRNS